MKRFRSYSFILYLLQSQKSLYFLAIAQGKKNCMAGNIDGDLMTLLE